MSDGGLSDGDLVCGEKRELLRGRLLELGFDVVRFARVDDADDAAARRLREWLAAGCHADMKWLERNVERRVNPDLVQSGAETVVVLGVSYWKSGAGCGRTGFSGGNLSKEKAAMPVWARYALFEDYHDSIEEALRKAGKVLEELCGCSDGDYRYYVDTGPMMERSWSVLAGVGFIGKNAMLISREFGNWLFLSALVTSVKIKADDGFGDPAIGRFCGNCRKCIEACPTGALGENGVVDARLCVAYHTIENRGGIPEELRGGVGGRIYGCDVCSGVCPWNRFERESGSSLLAGRGEIAELRLTECLGMSRERFAEVFRRTPIKRTKWEGFLRNACVVAGNVGGGECVELLEKLTRHDSEVVRDAAEWALGKIKRGGG